MKELKIFDDLIFYHTNIRDEAIMNFENGWGVHIYKEVRPHNEERHFSGGLMQNKKWYSGDYLQLAYAKSITSEGVTTYMRQVQQMAPCN